MAILPDHIRLEALILFDDEDDKSSPASLIPSRKEYGVILRQETSSSPLSSLSPLENTHPTTITKVTGSLFLISAKLRNKNIYLRVELGPDENTHE